MASKKNPMVLSKVGVKNVDTKSLKPNPHNPRMLFDKEPLKTLKESIDKVGILVPLTVYQSKKTGDYIILDGQRRWICAQDLGLEHIPINQVQEPTLVQNIVTMFQIHKLREDWELMPTALKLEVLMNELQEKNDKKLAVLTGLDPAVVTRCKKLLSYPRKEQDRMLDPDPNKRVKADFYIELYAVRNDRLVNSMEWYSKSKFTEQMLDKYQNKKSGLKAVTDFRTMKQYISVASHAGKERSISKKLKEFTFSDSLTLDHLVIKEADISAKAQRLIRDIKNLEEILSKIEVDDYYGEESLWANLEKLIKTIKGILLAANRRIKP